MKPTESQRICIEETFGMPSAVVAGAGSGKTATLTNRIVHALAHPDQSGAHDIGQILAITFTSKAAAELKGRIRAALQEAGRHDARLAEQALKVDGAWISTIHGMCSRILRENALTLGIDPAFGMVADHLAAQLRGQAIEEVLLAHGGQADVDALFDEYGRPNVVDMLETLIVQAAGTGHPVDQAFVLPPIDSTASCLLDLVSFTRQVYRAVADSNLKTAEEWKHDALAALERVLDVHGADEALTPLAPETERRLLDADPQQALAAARLFPKLPGRGKVFKELTLEGTDLTAPAALASCVARLRLATARPHLDLLVRLAGEASDRFARMKAQRGVLDNDDLLTLTGRAFRDPANTALREAYRNRFALVMVDEFQDTNQMQVDMINLVAGGADGHLSPRMCVVGDAQQSIYRFRNADLRVFKDYVAQVSAAQQDGCGRIVQLEQNFRSNGEVLAFCKGAFEDTFGRGRDYLELLHGRNEDGVRPQARFRGPSGTQAADPALPRRVNVLITQGTGADVTVATARLIARDLARLRDAGHRPGQMAVLLGRMTNAPVFAQALEEQGLPCAVAGGSVFSQAPEVQVVIDLCYALVNPGDTGRLVDVLASPLFALEADDLLALRPVARVDAAEAQAGGVHRPSLAGIFTDLVRPTAAQTEQAVRDFAAAAGWNARLTACLAALLPAAAQVGCRPLSDLVDQVLADSGWLARLDAADQAVAGNVLKAVRIVRDEEATQQVDALSLARQVEARIASSKEAPGVLAASGSDFVRIMTIHASKGLQFPITAVADTRGQGGGGGSRMKTYASGGRIFLDLDAQASVERAPGPLTKDCLKTLEPLAFAVEDEEGPDLQQAARALEGADALDFWFALKQLERAGEDEEYQRLLYVACTRAEECLIIALPSSTHGMGEGAPQQIGRLLGGEEGIAFGEHAYAVQLFRRDTAYPGHPDCAISWVARLCTLNAKAADFAEFADGLAPEVAPESEGPSGRLFTVPTRRLPAPPANHPYHLQWSEGLLSASALSHPAAADEPFEPPHLAAAADEDYRPGPAAATEKGTAFHALGEYAARAWRRTGTLEMPPASRVEALARLHGLDASQTADLRTELTRWLASPVAQQMAAARTLRAEVPFFIPLADSGSAPATGNAASANDGADGTAQGGAGALTLNGFIDLLAYDAFGTGCAHVVDYKTGCHLDTDAKRRAAYEIQAQCYAYALLLQGFERVELDFVFVDQPDAAHPQLPSVTHFPAPGHAAYSREALRAQLERTARSR